MFFEVRTVIKTYSMSLLLQIVLLIDSIKALL